MAAIGDLLTSLWYAFRNLFKILWWWICGIFDLADMFNTATTVLVDVFDFFPQAVVASLMAVCGGLLVLRLFGRS